MGIQLSGQIDFYNKLHQEWKKINETSELSDIFDLTLSFVKEELAYQRALIFVHDDKNGLFRIKAHIGYDDPKQIRLLNIVTLLLSGEIVEYLRNVNDFLLHTPDNPNPMVASLLRTVGMVEATMMLFAGNENVPFGLIVVGNIESIHPSDFFTPCSSIALRNLISNLSYSTNNVLFYQSWHNERLFLKENIEKRTRELNEKKETFEGIFRTSKDGVAIIDVHTTAFLDGNPAYLEMTGYSHIELLRTSCMALTHPDDVHRSVNAMQTVLEKGFVKDFVKRCVTKNDCILSVNMSMVLMSDQQRVLVTTKDITEQIQLEQELREAKNRIETAHNHTLSSIEYASLIQRSLLPEDQLWQGFVKDHFCIWRPKDVVGGDIYSVTQMRNEDELLVMLIDCTGHGVPGAFVTMLVKAIEQQLLNQLKTVDTAFSPAELLASFHRLLVHMLKYDENLLMKHIGFDCAVVVYNRKERIVRYAGAQMPLFFMCPDQNASSVNMIKGDRQSIGYRQDGLAPFTDHILPVCEGAKFYLTTDGYTDQLGGRLGLPLGKKMFQKAIMSQANKSLSCHKEALITLLQQHQQDNVQTDDITVLAFEI